MTFGEEKGWDVEGGPRVPSSMSGRGETGRVNAAIAPLTYAIAFSHALLHSHTLLFDHSIASSLEEHRSSCPFSCLFFAFICHLFAEWPLFPNALKISSILNLMPMDR
jgi:hypothetical protein